MSELNERAARKAEVDLLAGRLRRLIRDSGNLDSTYGVLHAIKVVDARAEELQQNERDAAAREKADARLEAALAQQKAALESGFERRVAALREEIRDELNSVFSEDGS